MFLRTGFAIMAKGEKMTKDEAINELKFAMVIIKQSGKDWLDERDIPILEMAIEALERKKGEWVLTDGYRCSQCNYKLQTTGIPMYCPNCGAEMKPESYCSYGERWNSGRRSTETGGSER